MLLICVLLICVFPNKQTVTLKHLEMCGTVRYFTHTHTHSLSLSLSHTHKHYIRKYDGAVYVCYKKKKSDFEAFGDGWDWSLFHLAQTGQMSDMMLGPAVSRVR